jgi:DNA replication and repair protein RecF
MLVRRLWLADFRNYVETELTFAEGLTVVVGQNGQGKTNLVEAIGYLATLESFRGVANEALVRVGADQAVVRAEVRHDDGREVLIEAELPRNGRGRVQVNRQRLTRTRDLLGVLRVSVFAPDDLVLVKGAPSERRRFMDDTAVSLSTRHDARRSDLDRILRQRTSLLKQAGGRLTPEIALTLDVWDAKLAKVGEELVAARVELVEALAGEVAVAYEQLAADPVPVSLTYVAPWRSVGLATALAAARTDDVRRAVCTVGPHRDDLEISLRSMPTRTHASQGEQRCLALALRLAAHRLVGQCVGSPPVLLLDDVFSELDASRTAALVAHLPRGQALLTTAGELPAGIAPERVVTVVGGRLVEGSAGFG